MRLLSIVALFGLVGPPLGALLFAAISILGQFAIPDSMGPLLFYGSLMLLPLSYLIGGLQALASGVAMALWVGVRKIPSPWWVPVSVGIAGGLFYSLESEIDLAVNAIIVIVHGLTAFLCWLFTRRLLP